MDHGKSISFANDEDVFNATHGRSIRAEEDRISHRNASVTNPTPRELARREGVKIRSRASARFPDFFSTPYESDVSHLAAIPQGLEAVRGRKTASGPTHFLQHGLARDAQGQIRPKAIEVVEGASDEAPGANRVFVGSPGGLTMIDESEGNLNFDFDTAQAFRDRGVLPWDRVNKAKYRTWSPRALTNAQIPTDRVDAVHPIDKDHVVIVQYGYGSEDQPSIALLDLTSLQSERREYFTHGPRRDEPLILHTEDATTKEIKSDYYLADALGSITELVNKDGTITGELAYSGFGKISHLSGIADAQCYSYVAREFDKEVGLYFFRSRYYQPLLGIFLIEDDYELETVKYIPEDPNDGKTVNIYYYALANPIKYVDNGGLSATVGTLPDIGAATVVIGLVAGAALAVFLPRIADATFAVMQLNEHIRSLNIFTTLISSTIATTTLFAESKERTAQDIISAEKKGSINTEFPTEMKGETLPTIEKLAKSGNPAAKKAKKLLTDKRFNKD